MLIVPRIIEKCKMKICLCVIVIMKEKQLESLKVCYQSTYVSNAHYTKLEKAPK